MNIKKLDNRVKNIEFEDFRFILSQSALLPLTLSSPEANWCLDRQTIFHLDFVEMLHR